MKVFQTLLIAACLVALTFGCTSQASFDSNCHGPRGFFLPFLPGVAPRASRTWGIEGQSGQHSRNSIYSYDWAMPTGTQVVASRAGTVIYAQFSSTAGNWVVIKHEESLYSTYMHLSSFDTSAGATLNAGDPVGKVGSTGRSSGPHLHMGLRTTAGGGNPIPLHYEEHIASPLAGNGGYFWPPSKNSIYTQIPSQNNGQGAALTSSPCEGAAADAPRNAACCSSLPTSERANGFCFDTSLNPGVCMPPEDCPGAVDVQTIQRMEMMGDMEMLAREEGTNNGTIDVADVTENPAGDARFVLRGTCDQGDPEKAGFKCCYATANCCAEDLFASVPDAADASPNCKSGGKVGRCMDMNEKECTGGEWVAMTGDCPGPTHVQCCVPAQNQCLRTSPAVVAMFLTAAVAVGGGSATMVYNSRRKSTQLRKVKNEEAALTLKDSPSKSGSGIGGTLAGATAQRPSRQSMGSKGSKASKGSRASRTSIGSKGSKGTKMTQASQRTRSVGSTGSRGSKASKGSKGRSASTGSKSSKGRKKSRSSSGASKGRKVSKH